MRLPASPRVRFVLRLLLTAFLLLCYVEAVFWPLWWTPHTVVAWWQVGWLATLGYLVGLPVIAIAYFLSGLVLPSQPLLSFVFGIVIWIVMIGWPLSFYWLLGALARSIRNPPPPSPPPAPAPPAPGPS